MDRAHVEHVGLCRDRRGGGQLPNPGHVAQDGRAEKRGQDSDQLESASPTLSPRLFARIQFATPLALPAQAGTAAACPEV